MVGDVPLTAMGVPQVVLRKVDGKEILNRIEKAWSYVDVRCSCSGSNNLGCSIGMGWPHTGSWGNKELLWLVLHHLHQLLKE